MKSLTGIFKETLTTNVSDQKNFPPKVCEKEPNTYEQKKIAIESDKKSVSDKVKQRYGNKLFQVERFFWKLLDF